MSDLRKFKLTDAAEIITGFPFKGEKYSSTGIRVVRGENVTIGNLRWDTIKCWNEPFKDIEKYSLDEGDIVIGMDGSRVGKNRAQIRKEELPLILAQRVARLRAKKDFSQDFLAYVIKSNLFEQYVEAIKTGTSIPHISPQQIKDFEFNAPNKETQQRIASILSSLDDKIELNRQTNQTLETLAQTLFQEMCVPKGEELPEGWRVGKLGEVMVLQRGFDLPTTTRTEGQYPVIAASGINGYHNEFKNKAPGVTTGRSGVLGNVFYIQENFWALNTSLYVKEFKIGNPIFSFFILKTIDLRNYNGGSAVPTLNRNDVHKVDITIPSIKVVDKFTFIAIDIYKKIRANEQENQTLISLRDSLLPKLMKGEIEI